MDYKFNQDEQIKCPICGESANYREFPDVVRLVEQLEKYKKREIISELFVDENKKYRQMWESYRRDVIECSDTKTYYNIILPLEQKYFPKEIIDKVIEGIIEQIKEGAEISRKETKSDGS